MVGGEPSARWRPARLAVGYGAIASALPDLVLKLVWLAGGGLGVADERMMRRHEHGRAQRRTAGMDLVAIGMAFEASVQRSSPHRHSVQVPLAAASATMAVAVGGLHLAWAFGSQIGVPAQLAAQRTVASSLINAVDAGVMIAGAAGVLMMVHGISRRVPSWMPLTLAWVGGSFLFAWGLWHLIVVLGNTPLARGDGMALVNIASLVRLIAGLLIGVLMLFIVTEREAAAAPPDVAS